MPLFQENLDGGLVNIQDSMFLEPGQLSSIRNAIYRSGSRALWFPLGRATFGTASSTGAVLGLRDITFNSGDRYLIAMVSGLTESRYRYASVGTTGAFADVLAITAGNTLERIQYKNRYYLLNGSSATASGSAVTAGLVNSNVVIYQSATGSGQGPAARQHGMLPVVAQPTYTTGSGVFSQSVAGYYEYWTTEVAKLTADGVAFVMESTYAASPLTINMSSTSVVPTLTMPPARNPVSTHWRVYRSPKKALESDKEFPNGFQIGEQSMPSGTAVGVSAAGLFTDSFTATNTGFIFPQSVNSGVQYSSWSSASAITAAAGGSAQVTGVGWGVALGQGAYNFNFGTFFGAIKGIEVAFDAKITAGNSPITVSVTIGRERQGNGGFVPDAVLRSPLDAARNSYLKANTGSRGINVTSSTLGTYTVGGSADRWMSPEVPRQFVDSDFNGNFMVVMEAIMPSAKVLAVDYVKVKVYYGAASDSVIQFPSVVYTFGDITAEVGKNGPPPSSSTGTIYQDTLVVNDVNSPGVLRYSYPGDPEAFPETYYLPFETDDNDQITLIKTVNSRLVIGLRKSLWRVNYLPSERDASFDRGKAVEVISSFYGAYGPMCACLFTPDGTREILVFASLNGIHGTDGYSFDTYTEGLEWRKFNSPEGVATPIALINDADNQRLLFFYVNTQSPSISIRRQYLQLNYSSPHWKDNRPTISGPVYIDNIVGGQMGELKSAWYAASADGSPLLYLGYGSATAAGAGQVYLESGYTHPNTEVTAMRYNTRSMFMDSLGTEWRLNRIYRPFFGDPGASATATVSIKKSNAAAFQTYTYTKQMPGSLSGHRLDRIQTNVLGETINFTMLVAPNATAYGDNYMILDWETFDGEDSGK